MIRMSEETSFALRLARFREARGLTRKQLALRLGCSPSQISRYESGQQQPRSPERFILLSAALGVSPAELLGSPSGGEPLAESIAARLHELALRLAPAGFQALLAFLDLLLAQAENAESESPEEAAASGPGGEA
jgi:transcriptional regulator with XRE-family HTH domain